MADKNDIRIQKTKEKLKSALLVSLKSNNIEAITISGLCSIARVNRNTFYSHYSSVKDLLNEIESDFLSMLISSIQVTSAVTVNTTELLTAVFNCVRKNKEMTRLLFSQNGDHEFLNKIIFFTLPSAVSNWVSELGMSEENAKLLYIYVQGGAVAVIKAWLEDGCRTPSKELAETLNILILHGQEAFSTGSAL